VSLNAMKPISYDAKLTREGLTILAAALCPTIKGLL
jgi:hypothetical protein